MLAKASLIAAPLAFPLLYNSTSSFLNNFVSKRTTVLHDLPDLGKPRPDGRRIQGTAVVCGGRCAFSQKRMKNTADSTSSLASLGCGQLAYFLTTMKTWLS